MRGMGRTNITRDTEAPSGHAIIYCQLTRASHEEWWMISQLLTGSKKKKPRTETIHTAAQLIVEVLAAQREYVSMVFLM